MNRKKITLFFLVSLMLFLALPAAAFTHRNSCNGHWTRWQSSSRTLNVSTHVSQFWTSSWQSSVAAASTGWNLNAPGNNFRIYHNWSLNVPVGVSGDGNDDLKIVPGDWPYTGYAAMTLHRKSDCDSWNPFDVNHYTEVDILLPSDANGWDQSTSPVPADNMQNTTLVLLREYGALMGLGAENDVLATMNGGFPGPVGGPIGNSNSVHPLPDDVRGSRSAYGTSGAVKDIAASAVRRTNPGVSATIPAPASTFRNAVVSVPFTILNRGTQDETSIPVYFYLSPTRWTEPGTGFYLGSTTIALQNGRSVTGTAYLTIPANAPTGNQYIGWYADPFNSITGESSEGNNGVGLVSPTYVSTNRVPTACFTATPSSGYSPLNVSLNASCTSDPDGGTLTYNWDFGDGATATGQSVSHTFYFAGYFQVLLTVTDSSGASSQTFRYVSVSCRPGGFCPEEPQ